MTPPDSTVTVLGSPRPAEDEDLESIQTAVEELSDDEMSSEGDGDSISDAKDDEQQPEPPRSEGQ